MISGVSVESVIQLPARPPSIRCAAEAGYGLTGEEIGVVEGSYHERRERKRKARKGFVLFVVFRSLRDTKHRRMQIDTLVYELYGLTGEEMAVVEGQNH